jgi:hypothetical protein
VLPDSGVHRYFASGKVEKIEIAVSFRQIAADFC